MEHSEYIRTRSREDRERKNLSPPANLRRQLYRTNNLIKSAATRSSGILLRWGHRKPETTGLKVLHWTQIAGDKLGWAFVPEDHVFLAFSVRTSSKFPVFEIDPPAFRSGGDKAQKKQKNKKNKKNWRKASSFKVPSTCCWQQKKFKRKLFLSCQCGEIIPSHSRHCCCCCLSFPCRIVVS